MYTCTYICLYLIIYTHINNTCIYSNFINIFKLFSNQNILAEYTRQVYLLEFENLEKANQLLTNHMPRSVQYVHVTKNSYKCKCGIVNLLKTSIFLWLPWQLNCLVFKLEHCRWQYCVNIQKPGTALVSIQYAFSKDLHILEQVMEYSQFANNF